MFLLGYLLFTTTNMSLQSFLEEEFNDQTIASLHGRNDKLREMIISRAKHTLKDLVNKKLQKYKDYIDIDHEVPLKEILSSLDSK